MNNFHYVQTFCIQNNETNAYCISKHCKSIAYMCSYEMCKCMKQHRLCLKQAASVINHNQLKKYIDLRAQEKEGAQRRAYQILELFEQKANQFMQQMGQMKKSVQNSIQRVRKHLKNWFKDEPYEQWISKIHRKQGLQGRQMRIFFLQLQQQKIETSPFNFQKSFFVSQDSKQFDKMMTVGKKTVENFIRKLQGFCSFRVDQQDITKDPLNLQLTPQDMRTYRYTQANKNSNRVKILNFKSEFFNFKSSLNNVLDKINKFKYLHILVLENCQIELRHLRMISESFENIHTLELKVFSSDDQQKSYESPVDDQSIRFIVQMKKLRRLQIQRCRLTEIGLKKLVQGLPTLLKLDLSYSEMLTKQALISIKKLYYLEQLYLNSLLHISNEKEVTQVVDDQVLQIILDSMNLLEKLHIQNSQIGSKAIEVIIQDCPLLKSLNISGNTVDFRNLRMGDIISLTKLKRLTELSLKRMELHAARVNLILRAFSRSNVRKIDFSQNLLDDDTAKKLFQKFPQIIRQQRKKFLYEYNQEQIKIKRTKSLQKIQEKILNQQNKNQSVKVIVRDFTHLVDFGQQ